MDLEVFFFIESKLFQLVVEEGGNLYSLEIFERENTICNQFFWVRVQHGG